MYEVSEWLALISSARRAYNLGYLFAGPVAALQQPPSLLQPFAQQPLQIPLNADEFVRLQDKFWSSGVEPVVRAVAVVEKKDEKSVVSPARAILDDSGGWPAVGEEFASSSFGEDQAPIQLEKPWKVYLDENEVTRSLLAELEGRATELWRKILSEQSETQTRIDYLHSLQHFVRHGVEQLFLGAGAQQGSPVWNLPAIWMRSSRMPAGAPPTAVGDPHDHRLSSADMRKNGVDLVDHLLASLEQLERLGAHLVRGVVYQPDTGSLPLHRATICALLMLADQALWELSKLENFGSTLFQLELPSK